MGISEWSYHNDYNPAARQKMTHVDLTRRFEQLNIEVELGFTAEQTAHEVQRCLNCDVQTVFTAPKCIECDACIDICPVQCLTITRNGDEPELRTRLSAPADESGAGSVRVRSAAADGAHHGERRRSLRPLRSLCGTLPDGRLGHAEIRTLISTRRTTLVQPLGHRRVNDFAFKLANVNGTGSASANGLLMQAIFRMGIPVSGKNLFPSNIQGLPTWYEIRVNKDGYTARALEYDLMVAMNAQTYARDIREVRSGGYLLYDSSWPLDPALVSRRRAVSRRPSRADVQ